MNSLFPGGASADRTALFNQSDENEYVCPRCERDTAESEWNQTAALCQECVDELREASEERDWQTAQAMIDEAIRNTAIIKRQGDAMRRFMEHEK